MSYLCLFCVSIRTKGVVSTAECGGTHRGGKGGGGSYSDCFEGRQKIEGRQKVIVKVLKIYRLHCLVSCVLLLCRSTKCKIKDPKISPL